MAYSGVASAITPQAQVVVNCVFDRRAFLDRKGKSDQRICGGASDAHNYSTARHELAFAMRDAHQYLHGRAAGTMNAGMPNVFTSFNGYTLKGADGGLVDDAKKGVPGKLESVSEKMREEVVFVGVNLTTLDARNTNRSDTMACVISGMVSIVNTGPERLSIMQKIVWDVPRSVCEPSGRATNQKCVATVKSYDTEKAALYQKLPDTLIDAQADSEASYILKSLVDLVNQLNRGAADDRIITEDGVKNSLRNNEATKGALRTFVGFCARATAQLDRRVIGVVAQAGNPGETIDVLLGRA